MSQPDDNFKLSITALRPPAVPSEETIIATARRLTESTSSWKQGKTYHKTVKTYQRPKGPDDGAPWHCRVSEHAAAEAMFDQMWDKLGKDKAVNEKEFIPEIKEVKKVKDLSPTASIWTLYYTFTPPVAPRVFTVLQVVHLDDASPRRKGMIVSIPIDLSGPGDEELAKLEAHGVRGRYVSVETLTELENGNTEWRMATSSTPGGSIPSFIVESTMASKVAQDVPHFMHWLHALPK
ncbi:putative protein of unknown function (DUF3074) [Lyophyllum shimeji]|uniref:DUF3074 domain-containing protein n=1 Tax=Lyophyllum shimeji TaxID=47721 RepID=A0A9P3PFR7_LYOSH|nr:putative protein of unknown function (DUF3074) [Lyophyllum shimeji]